MSNQKLSSVYIAWQSPKSRTWHPIGKLSTDGEIYVFNYTKGALQTNEFTPLIGMENLHLKYKSKELFPVFANRLLSQRRPEYKEFLSWLDINQDQHCPMVIFAKSGGMRNTDNLQIIPEIIPNDEGNFELDFFVHGIKYLAKETQEHIKNLKAGESLFLLQDVQNENDQYALAIRKNTPPEIIGYCPRYLAKDFNLIISNNSKDLKITIAKVNSSAPTNYQLMCKASGENLKNKNFFSDFEFEDLNK